MVKSYIAHIVLSIKNQISELKTKRMWIWNNTSKTIAQQYKEVVNGQWYSWISCEESQLYDSKYLTKDSSKIHVFNLEN